MKFHFSIILAITILFACCSMAMAEPVQFSRDIHPILSENCFQCHGPDPKSRQAGLRLDLSENALRKDDPVIVPGKSADSELIKRIISADPDAVMPPPDLHRKLTPQQVALLKRWIDEGAKWGRHWAFEAPQRPPLPKVKNERWAKNPIDRFVLARLQEGKVLPSPQAPKETLIRRVSLDLTGLPPTPAETQSFLADTSANAYEKVVDRLLKSPAFGERMVWEWLEAARYADTNGYQGDPTRTMHFWRDWAVQALNSNKPFDEFTVEQLAGDLLPDATQAQKIATGFHRNHMINGEGGRIAEESRVDYVLDRTETTSTVWMGLTLACARCHDHKFDPLTQRDYYQVSAYFNSIDESGANDAGGLANPLLSLASSEQAARLKVLGEGERTAKQARDEVEKSLLPKQAEWEQALIEQANKSAEMWQPLKPDELKSENGSTLETLEDNSIRATGTSPDKDTYTIQAPTLRGAITGLKLEVLADESFVNKGPGRADNGNFVLNEVELRIDDKPVPLAAIKADFEQQGWPLTNAVDGKPDTGWAIMPGFGQTHTALFQIAAPMAADNAARLSFKLLFGFGKQHTLGRFKLYATTASSHLLQPLPDGLGTILSKATDTRSDAEKRKVAEYHRGTDVQFIAAQKYFDDAKRERETFEKTLPRTMVMREREKPRDTFMLLRGVYDKHGDKVAHGVPAVLPPLPTEAPPNRLALARWLVSPAHPLTARVAVNRYWQTLFGIGLVKTTDDFGVQGERPSHPQLLDWLAMEFMKPTVAQPSVANGNAGNAWNVKHLLRLMVTSATYRQSSKVPKGMAERDPQNRLLARGPRYRWPSWMIRDQALAASGLLVQKSGGPPVKGYQPPGIWEEATFGIIRYEQDHGEALYRRSLYQFWRRIVGPTMFFDVATRQSCQVNVLRTNTPLQALITLNDVTYIEAARALAQRVLVGKPNAEQRIETIYRLVLSRRPTKSEAAILTKTLGTLRAQFAREPDSAKKLLSIGEEKRDEKLDPIEHAAYTALCNLILNLDETLTKE